eukprot:TRINITY_DN469_c0_g1_i3.p1 TRINITY_DN469_c0_g1~~TRINITY_DN469_c0_g1_i3.p1  ORF type:complete len:137 (+),score=34.44 TRINITY_DN469_c0_g1_i3:500-910(+)
MEKLSQGVNINQQTIKGETVLHYCLRSKTPLFLEKLLILGASVNTKNKRGSSPFHTAIMMGKTEAVISMIHFGADLSITSQSYSPLELARKNSTRSKQIIEIILKQLTSQEDSDSEDLEKYEHITSSEDDTDSSSV